MVGQAFVLSAFLILGGKEIPLHDYEVTEGGCVDITYWAQTYLYAMQFQEDKKVFLKARIDKVVEEEPSIKEETHDI